MNIFRRAVEKFKAWHRGEVMTKGASRGRCFQKKATDDNNSEVLDSNKPMHTKAQAKVSILSMRVVRKDGSTEEINNG